MATQLFWSGQCAGFAQTPNGRAGYPQQHQHYGEAYEGLIGKAVEIAQGIGKGGADAVRLRGNFTWLAVTACSFSFMDELQVCATDQRDVRCIQPSGFTVFFRMLFNSALSRASASFAAHAVCAELSLN